jgi:SAM-dependent methyltransferase
MVTSASRKIIVEGIPCVYADVQLASREDPLDSTRAFYERRATEYAASVPSSWMEAVLSEFAARLPAHARAIDLGCGAGRDLNLFRKQGIEALGLDYSRALALLARARSGAPVVVGDMRRLPFAAWSFDGAWASASLLHLRRYELQGALNEAYRVLRPGGLLFTSIKAGSGEERDKHGRWFSYYGLDEWIGHLGDSGFSIIETQFDHERRRSSLAAEDISWIRCVARRD